MRRGFQVAIAIAVIAGMFRISAPMAMQGTSLPIRNYNAMAFMQEITPPRSTPNGVTNGGTAFSPTNCLLLATGGKTAGCSAGLSEAAGVVTSSEPFNLTAAASSTNGIIQFGAINKGVFLASANTIGFAQDLTANWLEVSNVANSTIILPATGCLGWSSSANFGTAGNDTCLFRDGTPGFVAVKGGAAGTVVAGFRIFGTNGAFIEYGTSTELLTLSTSGSTTDTTGNLLPANSIIDAVDARVTTTITTATSWQLGDASTAGRFSAVNSTMTAGSTQVGDVQADQTGASGPRQVAAAKVRVTTVGTPGAGVIRITVHYHSFTPPTS